VVGAVVLTVTVEVPESFVTELGLSEHVAGGVTPGTTPQDRFTVPLRTFIGAMVIVEVAVQPAVTETGESVEAAIVKSATGAASDRQAHRRAVVRRFRIGAPRS